ncbi:phage holin [Psychrobacillus psychrotolerans]|uniref:phage holin n=1 Tax=Psychrobacillus psychrotolerans TaxID=126156 RepID=UPI000B858128|nr:phage holin [Psychrobacillus psychrotolerans]
MRENTAQIGIGLIVNSSGLIDLAEYNNYVDAFILVLIASGVVANTITQGLSDSKQALIYNKPKEK